MTLRSFLGRARRAASRSPGYLLDRARESGRRRLQRPWARVYPWLVREKGLLDAAGAASIDALWTAQQDVPFFLSPASRVAWTAAFVSRFPTAGHLISWAGLCPKNDESAGKRRSNRMRKGAPWLKTTLIQCASWRNHAPVRP